MRISVVGCGYLGAVHAACMAELGHEVTGIDVDEAKIEALSAGRAPFYEPGFDELLTRALGTGRLRFTTDPGCAGLAEAELHFIAVGTPQSETGAADLSYVDAAVQTDGGVDGMRTGRHHLRRTKRSWKSTGLRPVRNSTESETMSSSPAAIAV